MPGAASAELRLAISSLSVLRVMAVMRLDSVLRIYPSLDVALAPSGRNAA